MVEIKIKSWILIGFFALAMTSLVSPFDLSVQITDTADYKIDAFEFEKNNQQISTQFSVENTGSISCMYQAAAVYNGSDSQNEVWSSSEPLMPGESTQLETNNIISNTSEAEGQVAITFCENQEIIETGEFELNNSAEEYSEYEEIESLTMEASSTEAGVTVDVDEGLMIPARSQGLWRLSSHEIEDGTVKIDYRPEVYSEQVHEYYIVQDGEVVGVTEVDLSDSPTIFERIGNFRYYLN